MYQAVEISGATGGKRQVTHAYAGKHLAPGANISGEVTLELIPNIGVALETETDKVIIAFNNLVSIQVEKDAPAKKEAVTKSKGA